MTGTEQRIVDYAAEYMIKNGYPPTVRDITMGLGYKSTSTVFEKLVKMRQDGIINYIDGSPRTLTVPGCCYVRFDPGGEEAQKDGI